MQQVYEILKTAWNFLGKLSPFWWGLIVLVAVIISARIFRRFLDRSSKKVVKKLNIERTTFKYISDITVFLIYFVGAIVFIAVIPSLNRLLSTVLAGAGIMAIVIGFAARSAFSNIISGFFISIFKPFKIGDTVTISGEYGRIEDINLSH